MGGRKPNLKTYYQINKLKRLILLIFIFSLFYSIIHFMELLVCIKSSSQMMQVIRLQYVINSNLYQGMCSKQGPTLRELCLHFRLRTFR